MKLITITFVYCLVFALLPSISLSIERPDGLGNHLKLNAGEYLYAEDDPSLDLVLEDNFAMEFWFKLESVPELPFQQRVLFAKPGSYAVLVVADVHFDLNAKGLPLPRKDGAYLWAVEIRKDKSAHGRSIGTARVETGEWHHVAFETWLIPRSRLADTESRFYVGDVPPEALEGLAEVDLPYDPLVSAPLYLDEVRLSTAPVGHPKADHTTRALWHFDEEQNAVKYRDSAGANTLFRRSLSISARGALATTWARMKSDGF